MYSLKVSVIKHYSKITKNHKVEMSTCVDLEKPYCPPPCLLLWFALSFSFSPNGTAKEKKIALFSAPLCLSLFLSLAQFKHNPRPFMDPKAPKDF